uniref:Uncharacterized protein n=1 Tax=Ciona savignyi TaxID=51511 RepID=H2ZMH9_CIOSA
MSRCFGIFFAVALFFHVGFSWELQSTFPVSAIPHEGFRNFNRTYRVFCTNITSEISKDSAQETCANSTSSIVRNISSDDLPLDLHCFSQKTCPR